MKKIYIILSIIFFILSCESPQTGGTASPNFVKKGVIKGNVVLSNALVVLYQADNLENIDLDSSNFDSLFLSASFKAIDTTISDQEGNFVFENIEEGIYSLEAKSEDSSLVCLKTNIFVEEGNEVFVDTLKLLPSGQLRIDIFIIDSIIKAGYRKGEIYGKLRGTPYTSPVIGNGYMLFEGIMPGSYVFELHTKKDHIDNIVLTKEVKVISNLFVKDTIKGTTSPKVTGDSIVLLNSIQYKDVDSLIKRNKKVIDFLSDTSNCIKVSVKVLKLINLDSGDTIVYPIFYTVPENKILIPLNIEKVPKVNGTILFIYYKLDELIYGFDAIPFKGDYVKIYKAAMLDENNNLIPIYQ